MKPLDYIPGIVAFCALLLSIVGSPKWDSTRDGLSRLTKAGWLTLALGGAALLASQVLTWRSHSAADTQAHQKRQLRSIAHAEIRLALHQITGPFFILFGDDSETSQLQIVPDHIEDPERLAAVLKIDVRSSNVSLSGVSYSEPWAEILKGNADLGVARLDRALQIYAAYLEPEVLEVLSDLRTSEFLVLRLQRLDEHVSVNANVKFLPFPFASPLGIIDKTDFGFTPFWSLMRKLDGLLEKDPARLKRRL